eukprot:gene28131-33970_t
MHNVPKGSESHFKLIIVSDAFQNLPLVQRHRKVFQAVNAELQANGGSVHALSITAKTPAEWGVIQSEGGLSIGGYRWTVKRSFESIKDFHAYLHKDPDLSRGRSMLTATFPAGRDGEVDTMVLIERREMIEHFVREVLGVLDFMFYEPLDEFIEGRENVIRVQRKLEVIVRNMRSYIAKKKLFY